MASRLIWGTQKFDCKYDANFTDAKTDFFGQPHIQPGHIYECKPTKQRLESSREFWSSSRQLRRIEMSSTLVSPSLLVSQTATIIYRLYSFGGSWNGGTPSYHPFLIGIFNCKPAIWGTPMTQETCITPSGAWSKPDEQITQDGGQIESQQTKHQWLWRSFFLATWAD